MDTLSPTLFVNGELLRLYVERRVRVVVQVTRVDGATIVGQSTDGQQLVVRDAPSSFPLSHFIEVIGVAEGNSSICAEICIDFEE